MKHMNNKGGLLQTQHVIIFIKGTLAICASRY